MGEFVEPGADLGFFIGGLSGACQLFDRVEALVNELHIELDAFVGIGLVIANLLDFVLGERIAGVLGE